VARPIVDTKSEELVKMEKVISARGGSDIAKRSLQTVSQVFQHDIVKSNLATVIDASAILKPTQRTYCERVEAAELPMLLIKIEAKQGASTTRLSVKPMALTQKS